MLWKSSFFQLHTEMAVRISHVFEALALTFKCSKKALVLVQRLFCNFLLNTLLNTSNQFGPRGVFDFTEFFNDLHLEKLLLGLVQK
jgi:hypothetical protein